MGVTAFKNELQIWCIFNRASCTLVHTEIRQGAISILNKSSNDFVFECNWGLVRDSHLLFNVMPSGWLGHPSSGSCASRHLSCKKPVWSKIQRQKTTKGREGLNSYIKLNKIPFCIAVLWRTHKPTLDNSSQSYIHGKEDKVLPACLASCEVSAQSLYRGCNLNWTCRGRPWDTERQVQYLTVSPENTQHSQCTCWSFRLQSNTNTVMSVSGLITSSQFTGRDWNDYSQLPEN